MRCKILCAGLLASVAAGAGAALAADIAGGGVGVAGGRPGVAAVPVAPAIIETWTGFYVGIHGGGGSAHESFDGGFFDPFDNPFFFQHPGATPSGGVFGFQAGHNWQWGPVVGGLEIDFSGADIRRTNTFFDPFFPTTRFFNQEFKIDELASARGRLGWLIFPNWLIYGTAGIAWGHSRNNETEFETVFPFRTAFQNSDINEFGFVVGAGVEWKIWSSWLLRAEFLHYDFGRVNHFDIVDSPVDGFMFATTPITTRTTVDVGRAAISWRFGP